MSFHGVQAFPKEQRAIIPGFLTIESVTLSMARKRSSLLLALPIALVVSLLGSGCVYRQTIHQGNLLDQTDVDTLKPGMSKRQVALILGTPSVQSPFDQDRWDYV